MSKAELKSLDELEKASAELADQSTKLLEEQQQMMWALRNAETAEEADAAEKDLDEIANKLDQCWKLSRDTAIKIQN